MSAIRSRKRSPTARELAIWRQYVETSERVKRALASDFVASSGISPGDYGVMLALSEADGKRLRSSDLADTVGWERSRLSHHLRRMQERGLIERSRDDRDSRGAWVVLTEAGANLFRSSSSSHLRLVREIFIDAFTPEELQAAAVVSSALRRHLDARAEPSDP